jgi:hypothetical protein
MGCRASDDDDGDDDVERNNENPERPSTGDIFS